MTQTPENNPYPSSLPTPPPPAGPPTSWESPPAVSPRSGLAISALVVGIVAFLSGLVPFWGFIAGGAAVTLGAIALTKKQSKGLALTGLILGSVAAITSIVTTVILLSAAASVDDLTDVSIVPAEPTAASDTTEEPSTTAPEESEAPEAEGEQGSRENPASLGSEVIGDGWTVVVNSFTADGNEIVAAGNMFNEAPPSGSHYSIVNYTVTYTGSDSAYAVEVDIALVTSTGEVMNSFDAMASLEDGIAMDELYGGGTATGSVAFLVPDGADVQVRVTPGYFADEVFVATQ